MLAAQAEIGSLHVAIATHLAVPRRDAATREAKKVAWMTRLRMSMFRPSLHPQQ